MRHWFRATDRVKQALDVNTSSQVELPGLTPDQARPIRSIVVGAAALAVALASMPLGATAQDGPEAPVRDFLAAISEKRLDELGRYFCPEYADQVSGFDLGAEVTADLPPGIDPQLAVDALAISVTGPSGEDDPLVYVLAEDEDLTSLGVEATINVSLDPAAKDPFVRAIVENEMQSQGMEPDEESVQALMTVVGAQLGEGALYSEYLGEVAEVRQTDDGTWLICGGSIVDLDLGSAVSPIAAPASSEAPSNAASIPIEGALPFSEYVAALEAFSAVDPFAGMGDPPTKKEVVAGMKRLRANSVTELERLVTVVPEECYADAHAELLDYWQSSIEAVGEATVQLQESSLKEFFAITDAMDETLRERHPSAYVAARDDSGGFTGSSFNILAALATCDIDAETEQPAP